MSTFKREQREHAENISFDKAELYNKHLEELDRQQESDECEDILIAYIGLEEFKKLSGENIADIVDAMREYAENKLNK